MIFDRYRSKSKTRPDEDKSLPSKKSSLANTLFRKFPIHLTSKKKQKSQANNSEINHQPRPSLSLPNITTTATNIIQSPKELISKQVTPKQFSSVTEKQRKRHSAEQRRSRRTHRLKEDVARHSYTFGHLTSSKSKTLTRAELTLSQDELRKLSKLANLKDNTEFLLSKLGTQSSHPVPHRSISHQHLTINTPVFISGKDSNSSLLFRQNLNRAHSESHAKSIRVNESLDPEELVDLLEEVTDEGEEQNNITLIDVRNLMEYQNSRIRNSLNVNLPSLLIKRYQRGTVANFNLENFITTVEGRQLYTSMHPTLSKTGSILEQKAAEAELKKKQKSNIWVVYDEEMSEEDHTSQAWTLLSVLDRCFASDGKGKIYYLSGGFKAFEQKHKEWIESSASSTSLPAPTASISSNTDAPTALNIPRRSVSYTIGDPKNDLYRRTSLFSLDTQAARVNNANALARRAKRRSQQQQQQHIDILPPINKSSSSLIPTNSAHINQNTTVLPTNTTSSSLSALAPFPPPTFSSQLASLNRVTEDDEIIGLMTADASPRTESDFGFVISEIIPGFLFVGPEIETLEHANQLDARCIKRVLNMAEECIDEGLDEKQSSIIYHKIAARDTLEMKNIELVMMEAVQFIEEAKKNHEPIYVHCKAGKSRSITAILAYLVTSERWTLKRAYRHVIKARPNMSPNIGFISELMKMEGRVHGRVSSFMETDWQSTSLPSPEYANELHQLEKAWQQETTV